MAKSPNHHQRSTKWQDVNAENFRHQRALKVAHDHGLSPSTENTNGNENMDEDKKINQVDPGD